MSDYYFKTQNKSTNVRVDKMVPRVTALLFQLLWNWAPGFTRWLTLRMFFAPTAYAINPEEKACIEKGHAFQIQLKEKVVHAWRWGQGPAVLLVHGWSGRGIQFHRFVDPLVQAGYTAIALDMPAHGASTGRITSYFEFTDTLRLILSKPQGWPIAGIIAHSFGAAATINALAKEKRDLNAVCIAPILKLRELLLDTFTRLGLPKEIFTSLIKEFEAQFGYHLKTDNPNQLIGALPGQTLLVHDENDRTVAFSDSAYQTQNHAHLRLYATRGLGHRRILTDDTVVRACLAHIGAMDNPSQTTQLLKKGDNDAV